MKKIKIEVAQPQKPVQEGELIKAEDFGDVPVKYTDEQFDLATTAGKWLPRLQLMTSQSEKCKSGEFPINHYAIVKGNDFQDIGEEVDVIVLAWRPKALDMSGDQIISAFNPEDKTFQDIQEKSGLSNSMCMYGPEFLVWIAEQQVFTTFFMGTKSARREAPNLKARMHKAATLKSHKIETRKYTWYAPLITVCSQDLALPDMEDMREKVESFNSPPATDVEVVKEGEVEERAR